MPDQPPIPSHGAEAHEVVPPPMHASPVDMPASPADALRPDFATPFDAETPFWRPDWRDVARVIGWRWLILLPCAVGTVGLVVLAGFTLFTKMAGAAGGEIKFATITGAGAVSTVLWGVRNVIKRRRDPFCIHCGYSLTGLADRGSCPECGRPYVFALCDEFRKDPHFFETRFKSLKKHPPGFTFAAGAGPTPADGTA